MKKYLRLSVILLGLLLLSGSVHAQEDSGTTSTETGVSTEATVEADLPVTAPVIPPGTPANIRDRILGEYQLKLENARRTQQNRTRSLNERAQDIKATQAERRENINERKEIGAEARMQANDISVQAKNEVRMSSTSQERRLIQKEARIDVFNIRKNSLVRQLNIAINNLKQIRDRIESRIEKAELNGRDMTDAKALLVTADAKIVTAEIAINTVANISVGQNTSTNTSSTTIVDLERPRQLGNTAIKAVKEARMALRDVVLAIAHSMGLKLGSTATTTPSFTSTPSPTTTVESIPVSTTTLDETNNN